MSTDAGAAILPLAKHMRSRGAETSERQLRRHANWWLHRCDEWTTPYGNIIVDLTVEGSAGTLRVKALNTFAFFHRAARKSLRFYNFMRGLISRSGGTLTIALYTDGVVPRNKTRPDKAGSFEAIRITLCEFPHWLRTRKGLRWIPICYPKHDEMTTPQVTVSYLLKLWFPQGGYSHSWENGIILSHEGCPEVVMKLRFGPMPQDADAFKHVFSLTGSSGQSPCPWCSNCPGSPGHDAAAIVLIVGRRFAKYFASR